MPEDTVIICQHEDIAQVGFLFDEAYVILCRKQVGFGDLVSSPYLASCVLGWKLQVGGTLATFLCGGVVEFPSDFRQFLEGMEIVAVYSQFGNMEVLIGVLWER